MKVVLIWLFMGCVGLSFGQKAGTPIGLIIGNILDGATGKAVSGATVQIRGMGADSSVRKSVLTDRDGAFEIDQIPFGYYRLSVSAVGYSATRVDSVHLREERFDFNLGDIKLSVRPDALEEVVVYAEKPILDNKDGKITFNAGESALSAGSSTAELIKTLPLISNDANGRILLKGKEPKILIDDKPTELNAQQLNDLLEALPGSSIEKIELMANPPAQFATESGGVINIVTRKGKIGTTGRINMSVGSRGEANLNANISYRKQKLSVNTNIGLGANQLGGGGSSYRTNIYKDSTNFFETQNRFENKNLRPNLRSSIDYEIDKFRTLQWVVQFNMNLYDNENTTTYTNFNQAGDPWRVSDRTTAATGKNINPFTSFSYQKKWKDPRQNIRFLASYGYGYSENERDYFQQFMTGDKVPTGVDSTQEQITAARTHNLSFRTDYNKPIKWMNSLVSTGITYNGSFNQNLLETFFLRKPDSQWVLIPLLSNDFKFQQHVATARIGITMDLKKQWKLTTGVQWEYTQFAFDFTQVPDNKNQYQNLLPNLTLRKDWKRDYNLAFVYRKNIRRPGIGELNPSIDYGDPYNLRFGNPTLLPQLAHNFDINAGKSKGKFYVNASLGFNYVQEIIQSIRSLQANGVTTVTYQNITDRREYEASVFGGYTFSRKLRVNGSAGYNYNSYSAFDRERNRYRNGGSFYTSVSYNYTLTDRISFDGVLRYNNVASPQGRSRSNINQNFGMQMKFFNKRLAMNINLVDIFSQQQFVTITQGSNFILESVSNARTQNVRVGLSYNLQKNKATISNKQREAILKKLQKP
jgi:outer membrane receptor protein involved in Fe transport